MTSTDNTARLDPFGLLTKIIGYSPLVPVRLCNTLVARIAESPPDWGCCEAGASGLPAGQSLVIQA
jgi:hypothetical protein